MERKLRRQRQALEATGAALRGVSEATRGRAGNAPVSNVVRSAAPPKPDGKDAPSMSVRRLLSLVVSIGLIGYAVYSVVVPRPVDASGSLPWEAVAIGFFGFLGLIGVLRSH
jgi:hypothetical protein